MNHQKVYNNIIEIAKSQNRTKYSLYNRKKDIFLPYYEKHHIFPKCLKGTDDKENLVLLTAKEHYICHKLLTYIYKGNRKLYHAFYLMTFDKKGKHDISARDYAYARELNRYAMSILHTGRKLSKEHKEKISNGMKGLKRKPLSEEQKEKISKSKKGIPQTKEHIEKRALSNTGKKRSEETKRKIGEANKISLKGRILSEETKKKMSAAMMGKNLGIKRSDESKEKNRQAHLGLVDSEETKKRKSISHKGKHFKIHNYLI